MPAGAPPAADDGAQVHACPACSGRAMSPWMGVLRCGECGLVVAELEALARAATGLHRRAAAGDPAAPPLGEGFLRQGCACVCGGETRMLVEQAWLVCERCSRLLLPWSELKELIANPDRADIDPGILGLRGAADLGSGTAPVARHNTIWFNALCLAGCIGAAALIYYVILPPGTPDTSSQQSHDAYSDTVLEFIGCIAATAVFAVRTILAVVVSAPRARRSR